MQDSSESCKTMTILLFVSAFLLSSIAAYYAVIGLMTIFSGAAMSIAIMGGALEFSKIVVTSWLYRNWKETSILLKTYFVSAIIVLMTLTSMGIFGFLSKAHSDQFIVSGEVNEKVELIDEKIAYQRSIIEDSKNTIAQLNRQVDETINRTSNQQTNAGVNRSVSIRRAQAKEREDLAKSIELAQTEILKLNEEKREITKEQRVLESEVGPIKYIAEMIYGSSDSDVLEKAVRIMIILIVVVFDPLAVLMFIAVNQSLRREKALPSIEEPEKNVEESIKAPIVEEVHEELHKETSNSIHKKPRRVKIVETLTSSDDFKIEKT